MRLGGNEGGRIRVALWKPVALEWGREVVGSWWVRWETLRPKDNGSFETRRVGREQGIRYIILYLVPFLPTYV